MTVKLQNILRAGGHDQSLDDLFSAFEALPHPVPGVPKYAEVAASYSVLRQRGFAHDSAVAGLKAMLKDLKRLK